MFVIARSPARSGTTKRSHGIASAASRPRNDGLCMRKRGYVYIMTNPRNTVFYTGVTSDLLKRISEHRQKLIEGFTKRYNITKLVYYEAFDSITDAIQREKQIKAGSRKKKLALIRFLNPEWRDWG